MTQIRFNDDIAIVNEVLAGLKANEEKYGKRYCPCSLKKDEEHKCMCKEFREQTSGTCHCGLFIKEEK